MHTSDVLNKAADLIEQRGWSRVQGWANQVPDGAPLCLEGAIQAVTGLRRHATNIVGGEFVDSRPLAECPAYRAVQGYLEWWDEQLWAWNDEKAATASDVIEVLRACAVIEASRERETAEVSA